MPSGGTHPHPSDPGQPQPFELAVALAQVARGDHDAFALLYDQTVAAAYGLIRRVVRDPAQAEEVTQETFVQVWRSACRYDPSLGSPLAWVLTIAHRRAVDCVRATTRAVGRERRTATTTIEYDAVAEQVEDRLEHHRVRRCLDALTERQREAVLLAYYGGYSYPEVAALLDLPLGTVKTRIRDGLIRLRDCLGDNDDD